MFIINFVEKQGYTDRKVHFLKIKMHESCKELLPMKGPKAAKQDQFFQESKIKTGKTADFFKAFHTLIVFCYVSTY